jgi:uncharacterized protein (DUF2141 family)
MHKYRIPPLSFLLLLFSLSFQPAEKREGTLIIEIANIKSQEGIIWIGVYDSEDTYMVKEKAIVEGIKVRTTGQIKFEMARLAYGEYAIALFHDINGNGELDRNLVGIPSEPYAFSQELKSKWRLPRFKEVKFRFSHSRQVLRTELRKWWEG